MAADAATPTRRWWRPLALGVGIVYGLFYLYAIGDVTFYGPPAWGLFAAELSLERALTARSVLMFEAIAVAELGWVVWLVSPLNLFIGTVLAGLLAANLHGALYLHASPSSCRSGGSALAALPALLAGGACCAPGLILLLGIPALGALAGLLGWLVPVSIMALGLSRVWQHRQGAPRMIGWIPRG